jgi:hypothetical protein
VRGPVWEAALCRFDGGVGKAMEILPPDTNLPMPYIRRLDPVAERIVYIARPGIRALPSGAGTAVLFVGLQTLTLITLFWAMWWPAPSSTSDYAFAIGGSAILVLLVFGVILLLMRRFPGFLLAVLRSPFISVSVTDRRILWTLPWMRAPLMEIGRERVIGGIVGVLDRKGNGPAAVMLVPGDPSADFDGNIHFDRLPNAAAFVAALQGW